MGLELSLSQEHGGHSGYGDGCVPKVSFRPFDISKDMGLLAPVFQEYQKAVNQLDLSDWMIVTTPSGEEIPFSRCEVLLCKYDSERTKFQLILEDNDCVGFLMYHLFAECILYVVGEYIRPGHEKRRLARDVITSLGKPIRKIIFKTIVSNPNDRIHKITESYRTRIADLGDSMVWEMPWEGSNG